MVNTNFFEVFEKAAGSEKYINLINKALASRKAKIYTRTPSKNFRKALFGLAGKPVIDRDLAVKTDDQLDRMLKSLRSRKDAQRALSNRKDSKLSPTEQVIRYGVLNLRKFNTDIKAVAKKHKKGNFKDQADGKY